LPKPAFDPELIGQIRSAGSTDLFAENTNVAAATLIVDRLEGTPPQQVNLNISTTSRRILLAGPTRSCATW
jgi:hypothetical protein